MNVCFILMVTLGMYIVAAFVVEANMPHVRRLPVKHVNKTQKLTDYYTAYMSSDPLYYKMGQNDPYQHKQHNTNWPMSSQKSHQKADKEDTDPLYRSMPVWFDQHVFHDIKPAQVRTTRLKKRNSQIKHFHDIFARYEEPQQVAFGHIELGPKLYEQRFETINKGNRYKGDIKWYDPAGGYGAYHWNLAQGKL